MESCQELQSRYLDTVLRGRFMLNVTFERLAGNFLQPFEVRNL